MVRKFAASACVPAPPSPSSAAWSSSVAAPETIAVEKLVAFSGAAISGFGTPLVAGPIASRDVELPTLMAL